MRSAEPRIVAMVGHVELRAVDDDDVDAIFEMMRDREAVELAAFTADDPDDRGTFDEWMTRHRTSPDVSMFTITERGGFAGTAATFTVDGDREITFWVARHAWRRGVATAAVRLLVSREAVRPLFARAAAHNLAAQAVLRRLSFTEVSRDWAYAPSLGREIEEIVFTLVPVLE